MKMRILFNEEAARAEVDNQIAKYQAGGHGEECECGTCVLYRIFGKTAPTVEDLPRLKDERIKAMRDEFYRARIQLVLIAAGWIKSILQGVAYGLVMLACLKYLGET